MNPIHALSRTWQARPEFARKESDDLFVVGQASHDWETGIATLRVVAFLLRDGQWHRINESHRSRAWHVDDVRGALRRAGFHELACWGSLSERNAPRPDDDRVLFVVKK